MAQVTYPARMYLPGIPLLAMKPGGYQRRVHPLTGSVTWYFALPVEAPVYSIPDMQVPTLEGKPIVTIGHWMLNETVWIRLKDKV